MALADPYVTLQEAQGHLQLDDSIDDSTLTRILTGVSRQIERHCGRQFNDAGTATARIYNPHHAHLVRVDEFHTTTGLVVKTDTGNDGAYATTITNYVLHPLNGVVDGQTGHPYREIVTFSTAALPLNTYRPSVQVTARWGWASVPGEVKEATLIQAARIFGRRYSHNGLVGQGDFVFRVSTLELDPDAVAMLSPYRITAEVA